MSLRGKFILYLALLHLALVVLAVLTFKRFGAWFFTIELVFVISLVLGWRLVGRLVEPLRFLRSGAEILKEEEYSTRFRPVGQLEMDQLIAVYNRMLEGLQRERLLLGEQRGFLEKLLEATPAGILTLDFDERISMVNPGAERFLQLPAASLLGKRIDELDSALATELLRLVPGEPRLIALQGGRRLRSTRSHFIDRGFRRPFLLLEELTEELRLSEKAAYEKLIRMMSHEVNNTVGSTNSLLQSCLAYRDQLAPADREEFDSALGVVIARNENLNAFMRQFANVVRLPDPVLQQVDLAKLVQDVGRLMTGLARERGIEWEWQLADDGRPISMDRNLMEQALVNIFKNASEAIDGGGTITVRLEQEPSRLRLTIIDSGGELTPEVQAQVFTPFFTTKTDGQGVGLTVVREILTRHRFDFALDGTPGQETRFSIFFPRRPS